MGAPPCQGGAAPMANLPPIVDIITTHVAGRQYDELGDGAFVQRLVAQVSCGIYQALARKQ